MVTEEIADMAVIVDQHDVHVFASLKVGECGHHAVALSRVGGKFFDKTLPNGEARLQDIPASLARHGKILLVMDQPETIGGYWSRRPRPPAQPWATCRTWRRAGSQTYTGPYRRRCP
ncbi:hypothetical protein [Arthrobacter sp. L77]|uniref:hypothetical protein n=1 Tax=Arthrobacter sp. L77 TaxID=1496689 RepID=UPI0012E00EC6|nr:hypothetical protein [Arthrobacter sp. L77]